MSIAHGISQEEKQALLEEFPDFPEALMEILEKIDGTYWREYGDEKVTYFFFGSDIDDGEYPYYLFSHEDIMQGKDTAGNLGDLFYDYFEDTENDYGIFIDDRILNDVDSLKWLRFSDCMNNGGTSSLYVDFTPSDKGKCGQIIRYLHDPDELRVIADSFEDYLDMLNENGMKFIHEDDFE
ncbi:MAG: SMI1/KNR4 family protein [Lachnospiraceae bacterium]|nr:SMI1/KNR4 family protein [Lachnospiraceae bacterium]